MTTSTMSNTSVNIQPIPEGLPIPNRKVIRGWIEPFAEKQTLIAIALLVADIAIWFALIVGVVLIDNFDTRKIRRHREREIK